MGSDLETLILMGFERPKAELAIKKAGGRMHTRTWLATPLKLTIENG